VHWKLPITLHWNWKFQWKVLEVLEVTGLPILYVQLEASNDLSLELEDHWKLPITTPT